jgi:hypothetical protein
MARRDREAERIRLQRYSTAHKRLRKQIAPRVAAGNASCARCGEPIQPGEKWDLDHTDDGSGYLGPSHVRCNRATAGRRSQAAELKADDPANGVYWGPPHWETGRQSRWSRPWFDWRRAA